MPASLAAPLRRALAPFAALLILAATFVVTAPDATAATRVQRIGNGLDIVRNQVGDPYRYGAAGPNAFDCSGLLYYSFRKAGLTNIPRTSSAQARFADRIPKSRMRPGDLMFFYSGSATASNVYHVAVFARWKNGHRVMIHAPSTGKRVHRTAPWTSQWFAGTLR